MREEFRESWGSRSGFVLAAIGSAVGLGNLWGFPYKLYSHGGGAFLIPYVIAMLLIGLPLLIAEFSLGHLTQRATPDAFGRANRKFAFVGWWQIILSFVIITYYAVILAWCLSFLYYSVVGIFQGSLPWAGQGLDGVQKAEAFFNKEYLHSVEGFSLGQVQWHIVLALLITWLAMYFCIFRGVKLVSKVVMWTVPIPWLMLLILTIRGLTLEGAVQGLEYYLEPNWDRLANPATWRWAFGQMFFSMSLAFGVMITYASFLHRKSDLNNNAAVIGLADMGTSFIAGLAVFATLGGMAFASAAAGAPVPVEEVVDSGPGLAFVAFPYALAQLPHAAWFSLLFFSSLLLLGIDSAFSISESILASIVDKTGWHRGKTLIGLSIVGLLIGLLFCMPNGINWLGTFDGFINGTWGITLTALLECLVLGWLFRLGRLREHANERSDWRIGPWWDWSIRLVIPVVLAALFSWSLFDSLSNPQGYARSYGAGEVSVQVPPEREVPEKGVLQLRFVVARTGAVEHEFSLDDSKAEESAEGWKILSAEKAKPLAEDFKARDLRGRALSFSTESLSPRTAYRVEYRWNRRAEIDPKTALAIKVAEKDQPKWNQLTTFRTASLAGKLNVGNTAGLSLMGLAPILAIIITSVRFGRVRTVELIEVEKESDSAAGSQARAGLAVVLGTAGIALLAVGFVQMMNLAGTIRADIPGAEPAVLGYLIAGMIAAGLALLVGAGPVLRAEAFTQKPGMLSRGSCGLGVLGLGIGAGLTLAFSMLGRNLEAGSISYNNELSGVSYLILGLMLGLIVVGLCFCFYRAIKAPASE